MSGRALWRLNAGLLALVLLLGAALAALAQRDDDPVERRDAHAEVVRAATEQVQAFLAIDHAHVDEQTDRVLAGATGEFKEQYAEQRDALRRSAQQQRSVATAEVLEVGVGEVGPATATVFVAADTEVTSKATGGKPRTVPWRIQLDLVNEGGRWLTSGLQFVE